MRVEQVLELELKPAGDDLEPEVEELLEDRLQIEPRRDRDLGPLGRQQAGEIDAVVDLERRVLEQIGQRRIGVGSRLELEQDPDVVGAQVLDVRQLRDLPLGDQLADPLDQRVFLDPVGDRGDQDGVGPIGMGLVGPAELDRPLTGRVDLPDLLGRVEDHAAGRKIGAVNRLEHPLQRQLAIVQQQRPGRCSTSFRLCGGMLVAMPTAIPETPLTSRFGNCAGRTIGSSAVEA